MQDVTAFVVRNGIDVLVQDRFSTLRGRRLALVTNHTGLTVDGRRTIDVLRDNDDVVLDKIFSPEHGLDGRRDDRVEDAFDEATGLIVHSLYGGSYKPTPQQLHDVDVVLFDLADVGCRFYTYISTLGYVLEACAENDVSVYVLDRPNPINGLDVEGPCSDASCESFVAYHSLPPRHGLTIGEMARFLNRERGIDADLRIVTMGGWQRAYWHEHTGQRWVNPSPNIRDQVAAALYPGVGLVEGTNVSVGRGTDRPFHVFGAPWIDGKRLVAALEAENLPGLRFRPASFVPSNTPHRYCGERCEGVEFDVTDLQALSPTALGLSLIRILRAQYPAAWEYRLMEKLLARPDLLEAIEDQADELEDLWRPDPEFFEARAKALLY